MENMLSHLGLYGPAIKDRYIMKNKKPKVGQELRFTAMAY